MKMVSVTAKITQESRAKPVAGSVGAIMCGGITKPIAMPIWLPKTPNAVALDTSFFGNQTAARFGGMLMMLIGERRVVD